MNPQLALTPEQLVRVRRFVVEMRAKVPIAIIDAYYDGEGKALCPMSTGITHHVNPRGDIEPCPIIQFATENIRDPRGVFATMRDSAFLKDFREPQRAAHPRLRGAGAAGPREGTRGETRRARHDHARHRHGGTRSDDAALFSQWLPGEEIPEQHWMYRWAKKYWFNDFGAYEHLAEAETRTAAARAGRPAASAV